MKSITHIRYHVASGWLRGMVISSLAFAAATASAALPPGVEVGGELKQWHKVTLTLDGPAAKEQDTAPNPFTDYDFTVTFTHASGAPSYRVPGYFAADGNAANDNRKYCLAKSGEV